jgi:predicted molibdopterin-dependent oxidoreductase YjgC
MRLGRKVTSEGQALEGWRIASELAARLGSEWNLETVEDVQDEIARVAPAFAGVDASLLRRARDGVVLPIIDNLDELTFGPDRPAGGQSWEPIRASSPASLAADGDTPPADAPSVGAECAAQDFPSPPIALHAWSGDAPAPSAAPTDAYALRLVAARTLYGNDRVVTASPSLANLAGGDARLMVNRRDRERIGVEDGTRVRVISPRATLDLPMHTDPNTPEGVGFLAINRAGPGAPELIDVSASVTDVRVETIT